MVLVPEFAHPTSLPRTEEARPCRDDQEDSSSPEANLGLLLKAVISPPTADSLEKCPSLRLPLPSFSGSIEMEAECFVGRGDPRREPYGEGVASLDGRGLRPSVGADEVSCCVPSSLSPSISETKRRLRDRTEVVGFLLVLVLEGDWLKASR